VVASSGRADRRALQPGEREMGRGHAVASGDPGGATNAQIVGGLWT